MGNQTGVLVGVSVGGKEVAVGSGGRGVGVGKNGNGAQEHNSATSMAPVSPRRQALWIVRSAPRRISHFGLPRFAKVTFVIASSFLKLL
jgi:hypothetical protein